MAWLDGYNHRKTITIDHSLVPQVNFDYPVFVLVDADADIGEGIVDTANGYDIRFTTSDGETLLKYEGPIGWSVIGGAATARFHVKIPTVTPVVNTTIYIYFGNDDSQTDGSDRVNVWDVNFMRTYHLNETISTDANHFKDSTNGADHGQLTDGNANTVQVEGKLHKAVELGGDDDLITFPHNADLVVADKDWTIEAWVKLNNVDAFSVFLTKMSGGTYSKWLLAANGTGDNWYLYSELVGFDIYEYYDGPLTTEWTYVVGRIERGSKQGYWINDTWYPGIATVHPGTWDGSPYPLVVGNYSTLYFDGAIEEVRISNIKRDNAWLATTYNNHSDPGTVAAPGFVTWGGIESLAGFARGPFVAPSARAITTSIAA